jgi:hypothetical protein
MNVISISNSLSAESNLNINNTYNPVNDNSNTTDFRENNASNSEVVLLSSESRGRGRGRSRGRGQPQTRILEKINKPKLIWTQTLYTLILYA